MAYMSTWQRAACQGKHCTLYAGKHVEFRICCLHLILLLLIFLIIL